MRSCSSSMTPHKYATTHQTGGCKAGQHLREALCTHQPIAKQLSRAIITVQQLDVPPPVRGSVHCLGQPQYTILWAV